MESSVITIKRRNLPHWTMKDATYFITFRTKNTTLSFQEQSLVVEHIKKNDGKFYELSAFVVMPDHVHMIVSPNENVSLSRIMKGLKGVSARKINALRNDHANIWQSESFDRIIRDEKEFNEKMLYMFNNPVKEGLCDDPWNYAGWYCRKS